MIDVTDSWWLALVIAGIGGLVGGFANELISSHTPAELELGRVELSGGRGLYDLGYRATMIVGAVTAIAFLYFFEPNTVTGPNPVTGKDELTREYDVIKLLAATILVGSGGPSVLKSLRERVLRAHTEGMNVAVKRIAKGAEQDGVDPAVRLKAISDALTAPGSN